MSTAPGRHLTSGDELRLRAALLSNFELDWIGPGADDDEARDELLADCERVRGAGGFRRWAMADSARADILAEVSVEQAQAAWRALVRRPEDDLQWVIDWYLEHLGPPDPAQLTGERLKALASAAPWLGVMAGAAVIDEREIHSLLGRQELRESLTSLCEPGFVGRQSELAILDRALNAPFSVTMIHGWGGMGKSALLARHLLDAWQRGVPLAYLTFDQDGLDAAHPATLIAGAARQLALFVDDERAENLQRLVDNCQRFVRLGDREEALHTAGGGSQVGRRRAAEFAERLTQLMAPDPFVVVIDTVEEVQRRGLAAITSLGQLLEDLRPGDLPGSSESNPPGGHFILAGRAEVGQWRENGVANREIALTGLDRAEAIQLLERLMAGQNEMPKVDLGDVVDSVGSSPLSIRLAAGVLGRTPDAGVVRDLRLRRVAVDGELYRRLLDHIQDERIRSLAYPGLTLRRVTPELIREVLAGPCGVNVPDQQTADELFDGLAAEAMLVEPSSHRAVLHRRDIRALMIEPLTLDFPDTVRRIHKAAVRYHTHHETITDRAEELYHRLMLGQKAATLDKRWQQDTIDLLLLSFDELPPASKAYLAAHSDGIDISDDDLREAELSTQRRVVTRRVSELLDQQLLDDARRELSRYLEATADHAPDVQELLVSTLELLGDGAEAITIATEARDRAAKDASPADVVRFTLHLARMLEPENRLDEADRLISDVLDQVRGLPESRFYLIQRLRLVTARLRIGRLTELPATEVDALADEAARLFDRVPTRDVGAVPGLLRDLAGEMGSRSAAILRAALTIVGVEASDPLEEGASLAEQIDSIGLDESQARSLQDQYARESDSVVYRRKLRTELRRARENAGKTQREVAMAMDWSMSKLIRMETGDVRISTNDLRALMSLYRVSDTRTSQLVEMARKAREPARWSRYRDVADPEYLAFLGFESSAAIVRNYEPDLVPGLLQTEEYARHVIERSLRERDSILVDGLLDLCIERQELLVQPSPPDFHFLVDESTIRRMIGSRDTMRRQLTQLAELARQPFIMLRILPFELGNYHSLGTAYTLLEFSDPEDEDLLYVANSDGRLVSKESIPPSANVDAVNYLQHFWQLEQVASVNDSLRLLDEAVARWS